MDLENSNWWKTKKEELLEGIRQTKEIGITDSDILDIMEELLKNAKVRGSIVGFYEETK